MAGNGLLRLIRAADAAGAGGKKVAAAAGGLRTGWSSAARDTRKVTEFNIGNLVGGKGGNWDRAKGTMKWGKNNFVNSFEDQSAWGMMKGVGGHALRGGVAGGLIGGTVESAQGGSFWSGAKEGAWNGAVGWSAYRSLGRATGAASRNPLSTQGPVASAGRMWSSTGQNSKVSKQAVALLNQKQRAGLARQTMNAK
jgi:hypothetical protein